MQARRFGLRLSLLLISQVEEARIKFFYAFRRSVVRKLRSVKGRVACRFRVDAAFVGIFLLFFAVGCKEEPKYEIGVLLHHQYSLRKNLIEEMLTESYQHSNLRITFAMAENEPSRQLKQIRDFRRRGVDLLIVEPLNKPAITNEINKTYRSGIPVVLVCSNNAPCRYTARIGVDERKLGETVGRYVSHLLRGKGTAAYFPGIPGTAMSEQRSEGFLKALKNYPAIKCLKGGQTDWETENAVEQFDSLVDKHPDIDVVFALNDILSLAMSDEAQKRGLRHIKFIGIGAFNIAYPPHISPKNYDEDIDYSHVNNSNAVLGHTPLNVNNLGVEAVKNGDLTASFIYPTRGDEVLKLALNILEHKPYKRDNFLESGLVDSTVAGSLLSQRYEIDRLFRQTYTLHDEINNYLIQRKSQRIIMALSIILALIFVTFSFFLYRAFRRNRMLNLHLEEQNVKLAEQSERQKELNNRIEHETEEKINFFTNVSHEFRTPVTLISGPVHDLLQDKSLNDRQRELLTLVQRSTGTLLDLVNEILDFQKAESGEMSLQPSSFDLLQAVRAWSEPFLLTAQDQHLRLSLPESDASRPMPVMTDREKLARVYTNILSNAVKFTPEGGCITVRVASVPSEASSSGVLYRISVSDTGAGISPEALPHLFRRFYQAAPSTGGTGIGLALSRSFMELLGGTVKASSPGLGKGSTFTIEIPSHAATSPEAVPIEPIRNDGTPARGIGSGTKEETPANAEAQPAVKTASDPHTAFDVFDKEEPGRPSILIVDDSADMRRYLSVLLRTDYTVIEAADGRDGLEKAQKLVPDIILCDVMMPVMDGLSLVRHLKDTTATSHIPVCLLTARAADAHQAEGYDSGADAYLMKPFNGTVLRACLSGLLKNREKLRKVFSSDEPLSSVEKTYPREAEFMNRFRDIVRQEMSNTALKADDIAARMNLGRSQFFQKVKALTGKAPMDLVRQARIAHARTLLRTTPLSISEIAYKVGFSTPAHFSTTYRNIMGRSPVEERKASTS